jgi:hypothetical protein
VRRYGEQIHAKVVLGADLYHTRQAPATHDPDPQTDRCPTRPPAPGLGFNRQADPARCEAVPAVSA